MEISKLNIKTIKEGYYPRKDFTRKEELKGSIEKEGLLEPILVRQDGKEYVIIDGVRRFRTIQELGWKEVLCRIQDVDEKAAAHLSYLTNSEDFRKNLNPIEESLHIREMRERFGYSVQDLVNLDYAGDDQTIYNKLNLLKLPKDVQDKIAKGIIKPTEGYRIAAVKDPDLQSRVIDTVFGMKKRSVRKTERIIKNLIDSVNREKEIPDQSFQIPEGDIPGVFFKDSRDMSEFADGTIPLIVTSPNYGVGLEYEEGICFEDHIKDLEEYVPVWGRKLCPGGYLCVNFGDIHNFGSKNGTEPEIRVMGHIFQKLLEPGNIRLRDIKIWEKGMTFVNNRQVSLYEETKHTSYRSLHNFEFIYIFKKDGERDVPYDLALKSKISEDEWKQWVSGIWRIDPVKRQKGHPAQFPEEIPRRLIQMYSYFDDVVVDPAVGSGTTIKVARELGRKGYGYERDLRYKPVIIKKLGISKEDLKKSSAGPLQISNADNKKDFVSQCRGGINEILSQENKLSKDIASVCVPYSDTVSKKDINIDWGPDKDDPNPSGSSSPPQIYKPDEYDVEQVSEKFLALLPESCSDITPHLNKIILGECLSKLKDIPDNSVDLVVTDPPYGIRFMGKDWDKAVPSVDICKECLRVLKPGAFAFVMSIPRQDCLSRMISNLEEAGFKVNFSPLYWTHAQGFPKAHNIAKGIEKKIKNIKRYSQEAKQFERAYGGFQPKPAVEVIIVAMKPMDEKTYVGQALKNGKGITWLGDCRIPYGDKGGRFPANLLISDSILDDGKNYPGGSLPPKRGKTAHFDLNEKESKRVGPVGDKGGFSHFYSLDAWAERNLPFLIVPKASKKEKNAGCEEIEPKNIDRTNLAVKCKKCGKYPVSSNKNNRCECEKPEWEKTKQHNFHPTVKPVKLMYYLITMGSREGNVVLDPFVGSGTTCVAAKMLKRKFIGIELVEEYQKIAEAKVKNVAVSMAA